MIDLSRLRLVLLRRRAAGMVEYGALLGLIAAASLGAVLMLGQRINNLIERATDGVSASFSASAWVFDAAPNETFVISSPTSNPASTSRTFTLRNVGTFSGAVPARSISSPNAGDYAITGGTCESQILAPNETCTVVVTFTATGNVSDRTAILAAGGAARDLTGSASGFAPN
jgi:Flp pilus assembly pilin Flp